MGLYLYKICFRLSRVLDPAIIVIIAYYGKSI